MSRTPGDTAEPDAPHDTQSEDYTVRLLDKQTLWWKRLLDVQAPYRWTLLKLDPGLTLDIGCGIGRSLLNLRGRGVGVDHNPHSVAIARSRGLIAYTTEEFKNAHYNHAGTFDSLLLSHVAEHMTQDEVVECLQSYLPILKPAGKVILITPQEMGHRHDSTHVEFMDFKKLGEILERIGFETVKAYSFPFPRPLGRLFVYNEFVVVGKRKH